MDRLADDDDDDVDGDDCCCDNDEGPRSSAGVETEVAAVAASRLTRQRKPGHIGSVRYTECLTSQSAGEPG